MKRTHDGIADVTTVDGWLTIAASMPAEPAKPMPAVEDLQASDELLERSTSRMYESIATATDPEGDWSIVDGVTQLRPWGEGDEDAWKLPSKLFAEEVIGSAPSCSKKFDDETKLLSRKHARLVRRGALWTIQDLGSKNGTWIDGSRRDASAITPGTEIRVGGVVLVAESPDLVALRALLGRWIGFGIDRRGDLDHALRATRAAFSERVPLVLVGDGVLTSIAERLHRHSLGDRPFVVHHRGDLAASFSRAARGTLCVQVTNVRELTKFVECEHTRTRRTRVVVCVPSFDRFAPVFSTLQCVARIDVPRLARRAAELPSIVRDYAADFVRDVETRLRVPAIVDEQDLAILVKQSYKTFAEVEDDVRRLVVLRAVGVRAGQKFLRLEHPTLSKWATRRGLVTKR